MSTWSQVINKQNSLKISMEECLLSNFYSLSRCNFTKKISEYRSIKANLLDIARVLCMKLRFFHGTIKVSPFNLSAT